MTTLMSRSLGPDPGRGDALVNGKRLLVTATITYNAMEASVALTTGTLASSTALIGFGLAREKTALRNIALSFFALAAYVTVDAVHALTGTSEATRSLPGIVLAALSLAVMPVLSAAQRRAGRELGSASAEADSQQTLLCTYLSAVYEVRQASCMRGLSQS